jgi:hypothetical protein
MAAKMGRKIYRKLKNLGETPRFLLFRLQGIFLIFCASYDGLVPFRHFSYDTVA